MVHKSPYLINNQQWQPVGGVWRTSSANSDHGRLLLRYYREGRIKIDTTPGDIWTNYPELRLVNPYSTNWRRFIKNVRSIANQEHTTMSDSDSIESIPPRRMPDVNVPGSSRSHKSKSTSSHRPDAPGKGAPNIIELLGRRNIDYRAYSTHIPTRVYDLEDEKAHLIQYALFDNGGNVSYYTDKDKPNSAVLQFDDPLGTEIDLIETLTKGHEAQDCQYGQPDFNVSMDKGSYMVCNIYLCCALL